MRLDIREEEFQGEDQSWLGSAHGTDRARPITLDTSAFTEATHFPDGYLRSGQVLGKITATGKYGPYGASPSEVQTVQVDGTAGDFTLTFDGETTAAIAFNATAAAMQTALEALSNVNPGDVTVTGGPGGAGGTTPYTVTFGGQYVGVNVPQMTSTNNLTGGGDAITHATTTQGGGAVSDGREVARGHLYTSIKVDPDTLTIDPAGAIFTHGVVIESKLPSGHGLDAAAKADLKHIEYI